MAVNVTIVVIMAVNVTIVVIIVVITIQQAAVAHLQGL